MSAELQNPRKIARKIKYDTALSLMEVQYLQNVPQQ